MINFNNQIKKAKKGSKKNVDSILKKQKKKRKTQLARVEESRYLRLKQTARNEKITISKLLDEIIDVF